jgi:outer membrane protein OmpA-like peptidoglycan-associated protein
MSRSSYRAGPLAVRPLLTAAVAALVLSPVAADAQGGLLRRLRPGAARPDSTLPADSAQQADSAGRLGRLARTARRHAPGVGGVVLGAAGVMAPPGMGAAVSQAAAQLAARGGEAAPASDLPAAASEDEVRIPLHGVVFAVGSDTLDVSTRAYLRGFASTLASLGEGWTVQAFLAPTGDPARDRRRADRRAEAVRAALVAAGASGGRMSARGRVATPQAAPESAIAAAFLVKQP